MASLQTPASLDSEKGRLFDSSDEAFFDLPPGLIDHDRDGVLHGRLLSCAAL